MEHYKNLSLENIVYFCEIDLIEKTEKWKDVVGFEKKYLVSDLGRIKSFNKGNILILKQSRLTKQYCGVSLVYKTQKVHRLVAIAFIPNIENKPQVNHKNGIKQDNRLNNLEWATNSENQIHAFKNKMQNNRQGILHNLCKLTEKQVLEIRAINHKESYNSIGKRYGVNKSTISAIINRTNWKHI